MSSFDLVSLPPALSGPSVWRGADMQRRSDWIEQLSAAEVHDIATATDRFISSGLDLASMQPGQFALPHFAPRLARMGTEVLQGRGFVLLRGLPVQRWSVQQSATAFFGIGTHLGHAVTQNAAGHVLGHVQDLGLASHDPRVRIYQTAERQTFHTDSCDIVGLLCLHAAQSGGQSALVSSSTLWNEMRTRRPDLAALLLRLRGENGESVYRRIVTTICLIAPFFDDFDLEPAGPNKKDIILNWRDKGSDQVFGPHQLSDGTLRAICLVTLLLQPEDELPDLIIVDEPELGLHPYALNVVASLLKKVSHHTQVLISTQSSSFLDNFAAEDVVVVSREGKESQFIRPDPAKLETWLDEYSLGEVWEKNVIGGGPH